MRHAREVLAAIVAVTAAACERPTGILLPPDAAAPPHADGAHLTLSAASCEPGGRLVVGGGGGVYYNHLANSEMTADECWTRNTRASHTSSTTCGWLDYGYKFGYSSSVTQTVLIPDSLQFAATAWYLDYRLDFFDPNDNGVLTARVRDLTTGQVLAVESYYGALPDVGCGTRSLAFTGDLRGHTLSVQFSGSTVFSNTHMRVLSAYLWQFSE